MIGKTVSHYKILEELGRGGMGVVYKAEDTKLRRTVALKFLKAQALEETQERTRFLREAQSAAALDHPNICTVYEVGETEEHAYISMAYIEGESLKDRVAQGPVPLAEALDYALQAAEGLKAAHDKGIIHRDIKSSNLMVTPEGRVKVMDFGLAKTAGATKVTRTGTTLGTVGYMSPEQALGQEMDRRSDIWSLGVVLYEMLSGSLPFAGEYDPAILYSIVNERQRPLTEINAEIPLEVERVVERALEKDPQKRYQGPEELIEELKDLQASLDLLPQRSRLQLRLIRRRRQIGIGIMAAAAVIVLTIFGYRYFTGAARAIDSIAVLPFENASGDPEQEFFANGMTNEFTATLGQVGALTVKSSRSMMKYKDTSKPMSDIAIEVGVKVLLAASIQPLSGDRIRASVELINGATEELIWSQPFECRASDINELYNDIVRTICERIGVELTPNEDARLMNARAVIPEAHNLLLKAQYQQEKWSREGIEKAIEYLQQAIDLDPDYAQAYAKLADCHVFMGFMKFIPVQEARARAVSYVEKALEINGELSEAHYELGQIKFWFDWDWTGAEPHYRKALELDPNNFWAHGELGWNLMVRGRLEEAIDEMKLALLIDPLSYSAHMSLLMAYYSARQYDEAVAHFRQYVELDPNNPRVYTDLAFVYEQMGEYDDAILARKEAMVRSRIPSETVAANTAALDSAYNESGPEGYWMRRLERWKTHDNYELYPGVTASYYAALGDKDQAFAFLEKALEAHDGYMPRLKVDPIWDPLRDDPRFRDLLRRMNFSENGRH